MDPLPGTPGPDTIVGTNSGDLIKSFAGNDQVWAGSGDDTIYGGDGDDEVFGDDGNDIISGQSGNDTIQAGDGVDVVYGGDGNDEIFLNIQFSLDASSAFGGAGDDVVRIFAPKSGTAVGGEGLDTLYIENGSSFGGSLNIDFATGTIVEVGPDGITTTFSGFERLELLSIFGDDTVSAGEGDDDLDVNNGTNVVQARGGDDEVAYRIGRANTLDGGTGDDTLVATASSTLYFIHDGTDGTVDDGQLSQISGFEAYGAYGASGNDIVSYSTGNDTFVGFGGGDTCFGLGGNDMLYGQQGNDSLVGDAGFDLVFGGDGDDILTGGSENDLLGGGKGNDSIDAGSGNDRIFFYLGNDTVTGGDGADRFSFSRNQSATHLITDFVSGTDKLLFNPFLLQFGPDSGRLDPDLLSVGGPSGPQAQFVVTYDATADQTVLNWDPNGDNPSGGVYGLARIEGDVTIAASDIFIL